ncbi:hypothetical protein G6F46_007869 [Rhizopus delemar]|uniref:Mediator of RNA polymerase II transcription subunit 4 n=2 Tax=Rhizopus TaxID=4842 RepID=A0A9P7CSV3_9FUNG|nr:hypothetical protein G6F55_006174 [Rhizopus delemar]KAG1542885.1 hypothetical protein G6F51_007010 [Rhizopus arrhizus]KAG1502037.1 hypothetical protein G6F54_002639 [Rhizopus delemar]KAG1517906.1 hypothetical protein G6F53_001000 [Rhizopus delemar]KAG1552607.1 hypothetical protein G6F49_008625 [Rhizopus delemar]
MQHSTRDQVNTYLTEYADLVKKYFASLSTVADHSISEEANSPEQFIKQIITIDDNLQKAVEHIEEHQKRQQKIIQVQDEIQQYNIKLLNLVQKLNSSKEELEMSLTNARMELKATEYAKKSNINFTDILSYASKLSKYTSAPPNFDLLNRDAKIDFEKPYPDEERMRRGLLYWQNSSQQPTEEKFESSDSEISANDDAGEQSTHKHNEDTGGDPFWILDLNPDMQP